ncbi:DUF4336 domain-containing protein [Novosphingobium sp.]|uniref:DUF4336 domain-containing protein n=1 Tax=Novosphingobium sp. TaxID=1874826 RepID=UPI002620306F|nr:DUF4336 domain-containing protein [Novosphingobium sp.]
MAQKDHESSALEEIVTDRIWCSLYPVRLGPLEVMSRMTVVRLHDGALWVHSPAPPTERVWEHLIDKGPVRHVVAPNNSHHLHFVSFLAGFPEAQGYIAPGLQDRLPDVRGCQVLTPRGNPWSGEIDMTFVAGLPLIDEILFYHQPSRSLVATDLFAHYGPRHLWVHRVIARILGVHGRLATSRTMRMAISDPEALAQSLMRLCACPVERVIVGHGDPVVENATALLQAAIETLAPRPQSRMLAAISPFLPGRPRDCCVSEDT